MSDHLDSRELAAIRRALLRWYRRERRDLPWRRTRDPYAIWLSEIMLQQTQVTTVIPYYQRFLARFPSVADLAAAHLDEVLQHWAGLGYYRRARHLHRAALFIVNECGGHWPKTVAGLLQLPGVGAYTAAAIASIAFGVRAASIDGNVQRVLARLGDIATDIRTGPGRAVIEKMAERLLPKTACGDFNQAMMELGATICLPRGTAHCAECPVRDYCRAHAAETVPLRPMRTVKAAVRTETHVVLALEHQGRWLITQRPPDGLWGGLWELPTRNCNGLRPLAALRALVAELSSLATYNEISSLALTRARRFCNFTHQLSHRTVRFVGYWCSVPPAQVSKESVPRRYQHVDRRQSPPSTRPYILAKPGQCWRRLEELDSLPLSTAMRRAIRELRASSNQG